MRVPKRVPIRTVPAPNEAILNTVKALKKAPMGMVRVLKEVLITSVRIEGGKAGELNLLIIGVAICIGGSGCSLILLASELRPSEFLFLLYAGSSLNVESDDVVKAGLSPFSPIFCLSANFFVMYLSKPQS